MASPYCLHQHLTTHSQKNLTVKKEEAEKQQQRI